jgi:hypothetical protein
MPKIVTVIQKEALCHLVKQVQDCSETSYSSVKDKFIAIPTTDLL